MNLEVCLLADINEVRQHLRMLVAELMRRRNTVIIASLTAQQAQDIRLDLLTKVQKLVAELYALRNPEHLAEEGQLHVYRALTTLIRVENSVLNDAGLDEIQALLEDADGEISQAQPPTPTGETKGDDKRD